MGSLRAGLLYRLSRERISILATARTLCTPAWVRRQGARSGRAELARPLDSSGRTWGSWFASCDLAQPTEVRTSTRGIHESGCIDELVRFVEHVFAGTPKPSRAHMASTWSLVKLRDQEPSIGFQHPVHLSDGSRLVFLSHMVQSEGARDRVEGVIREREVLRERDLERCRHSALARMPAGAVDHLGCCINPIDRAGGCHPLGEDDRQAARAAAHIEYAVAWLELKIISQHGAEELPAAAEQPDAEVVNTCPADQPVAGMVIGMTGGVGHWHSLPEFPGGLCWGLEIAIVQLVIIGHAC